MEANCELVGAVDRVGLRARGCDGGRAGRSPIRTERDLLSEQRRDNLGSALADVMLLGGASEIAATMRFQRDFVEGRSASLAPVIVALRASLRIERGIEAVKLPDKFNFRLALDGERKRSGNHSGIPTQLGKLKSR